KVTDVAFRPDGQRIAVAGESGNVVLWDPSSDGAAFDFKGWDEGNSGWTVQPTTPNAGWPAQPAPQEAWVKEVEGRLIALQAERDRAAQEVRLLEKQSQLEVDPKERQRLLLEKEKALSVVQEKEKLIEACKEELTRGPDETLRLRREVEELRQKERAARDTAASLLDEAQAQRALAEANWQKAQRTLYASQIALAQKEWEANRADQARQALQECPENLRGWEWQLL